MKVHKVYVELLTQNGRQFEAPKNVLSRGFMWFLFHSDSTENFDHTESKYDLEQLLFKNSH